MFSSIGWPEIFTILVIGIIIIGPERMPRVVEDVRAAIFAARKAIRNAKAELNGEFAEDFEEFRKPMQEISKLQRMGPRGVISKALFDDDEEFMDSFDPKKIMSGETEGSAHRRAQQNPEPTPPNPEPKSAGFNYAELYKQSEPKKQQSEGWEDVT